MKSTIVTIWCATPSSVESPTKKSGWTSLAYLNRTCPWKRQSASLRPRRVLNDRLTSFTMATPRQQSQPPVPTGVRRGADCWRSPVTTTHPYHLAPTVVNWVTVAQGRTASGSAQPITTHAPNVASSTTMKVCVASPDAGPQPLRPDHHHRMMQLPSSTLYALLTVPWLPLPLPSHLIIMCLTNCMKCGRNEPLTPTPCGSHHPGHPIWCSGPRLSRPIPEPQLEGLLPCHGWHWVPILPCWLVIAV